MFRREPIPTSVVLSEGEWVTEQPAATVSVYGGADEDAALVARAVAGEPDAYDRLFREHYARVYNLAARLMVDPDAAADVAQTAFVRAYQSLARLRDGRTFLKFLYRIVVNLVRDRAKSERRKPWVGFLDLLRGQRTDDSVDHEPEHLADEALDPQRIVVRREFSAELARQIDALPLDFREAFVLHTIEGLDIKEIAGIVGVAEGTVKSRVGRARGKLRAAMSPWMAAETDGA